MPFGVRRSERPSYLPLETGWQCPSSHGLLVVHAEIWRGAIAIDLGLHPVKDAAQLLSNVHWQPREIRTGISLRDSILT